MLEEGGSLGLPKLGGGAGRRVGQTGLGRHCRVGSTIRKRNDAAGRRQCGPRYWAGLVHGDPAHISPPITVDWAWLRQ